MLDRCRIQLCVLLALATTICTAQSLANRLLVLPKPYESNKVKAALGEDFIMTCLVQNEEASPGALKWFSPGNQEITMNEPEADSKRVYVKLRQNQLVLHLQMLVPQDAGVYTCRGVQDGTAQEAKVELVLEKKISFDNTLPEQFLREGEDSVIQCRASSIPGPEITWFRKGINIEIKNDQKYVITNDGLTVKNAQVEDEGSYYCQASVTSTGEVKRAEIKVQVMVNPKWVTQPTDTEGVEGEDIVIKCEAFAKPRPVYRWYRGDVQLGGEKYTISPNTIRFKVSRYDTGTYTCVAENNYGKIQGNFRLNALVRPYIAPMEDVYVVEGMPTKLRCDVRDAYPKAHIKWRVTDTQQYIDTTNDTNFKIIDDSDQVYNQNDFLLNSWSELHITRADRIHKRNFTCVATNKAAFDEKQIQLFVEFKPTMLLNQEARPIYYSWLLVDLMGASGSLASVATRSFPVTFTCIADGQPKPQISWYYRTLRIKPDNVKFKLLRDEPGYSQLEVNPRSIEDFGDYQCMAENRLGTETRNIQLRHATPPKFAPLLYLKASNPETILLDIRPSDAPEADGGMPIEAFKVQWRFAQGDYIKGQEKVIEVDLTKKPFYAVEIDSLQPDTDYFFRVAAINRPGQGGWSPAELKVRTMPRRQPDPVRVTTKEECQASTRCYLEWTVDSNGGSIIREYTVRWRRISYKDSSNMHVNTDLIEPWSRLHVIKAPVTNYEMIDLQANSFYEVDILAKNDIGASASQPFRVRTLPGSYGEGEDFEKRNAILINRGIIIGASIAGALILFAIIDVILFIKSNCGLLAMITKSCSDKNKANLSEYKNRNPPAKIAQHNPTSTASKYQPIKQEEDNKVIINMKESS